VPSEIDPDEQRKFDEMGPIDIHECIDAHFQLEKLTRFSELLDSMQQTKG